MSSESDDQRKGREAIEDLKKKLAEPGPTIRVAQPDKWADAPSRPLRPAEKDDDSAKKP